MTAAPPSQENYVLGRNFRGFELARVYAGLELVPVIERRREALLPADDERVDEERQYRSAQTEPRPAATAITVPPSRTEAVPRPVRD